MANRKKTEGGLKVQQSPEHAAQIGKLAARPRNIAIDQLGTGLQPLHLSHPRDGLLYVPKGLKMDRPAPLIMMLHGAGGNAFHGLSPFMPMADELGLVLLAPESRGNTWDFLRGGFGPDIDHIDEALEYVFERCLIDPKRVAIEGFSDGASYALSIGMMNGDLFHDIIAFSPGFAAPQGVEDSPRIFVSHGIEDPILSITRCSRKIVPSIESAGFDVTYREFDGGHTVPLNIARDALSWFLEPQSSDGQRKVS